MLLDQEVRRGFFNLNTISSPTLSNGLSNVINSPHNSHSYIKMFVGQLPQWMDEQQLREMFEKFGMVRKVSLQRDRYGQSKGCCFVDFYTKDAAQRAQNALHNIKPFAGMQHPIQMKLADTEFKSERKVFVGMLGKNNDENEVRQLFSGYGAIEECSVLRDPSGKKSSYAFVIFATKRAAIAAIESLHGSKIMKGSSAPLVVKFADKRPKYVEQPMHLSPWNINQSITLTNNHNLNPPQQHQTPFLMPDGNLPTSQGPETPNNTSVIAAGLFTQLLILDLIELAIVAQISAITAITTSSSANPTNAAAADKQIEGPEGCNLLIFHLPEVFIDSDLAATFMPFGNVISAKVYIDKRTNMSQCFGFVSFDNVVSAQTAIQMMDGFMIGTKRLRVELKRSKNAPGPYTAK